VERARRAGPIYPRKYYLGELVCSP
jgi:hypothetical protein